MATYIKLFETTAQYTAYMGGGNPYLPNVSLCEDAPTIMHYTALIPVSNITLDKQTASVQVNGSTTLTATILPLDASNKNVTWTSSDTSKVTIDGTGSTVTLNCIGVGSSTITCASVSDPSISATCVCTVNKIPVTGISLNKSSLDVNVNTTSRLTAIISPSNATNKTVSWRSSNNTYATVDSNGNVTGKKAGTATITATSNDNSSKTASCTVTVKDPYTVTVITSQAINGNVVTENYNLFNKEPYNLEFNKYINDGDTIRITGKIVDGDGGQIETFDMQGPVSMSSYTEGDEYARVCSDYTGIWQTLDIGDGGYEVIPSKWMVINADIQPGYSYLDYNSLRIYVNGVECNKTNRNISI